MAWGVSSGLFTALGFACLVVLLVVRLRFFAFAKGGVWVDGIVVARDASGADPGERRITVEFVDLSGRTHRTRSRSASSRYPDRGEPVRVVYQTSNPEDARIDVEIKDTTFILTVIGALLLLAGAGCGAVAAYLMLG